MDLHSRPNSLKGFPGLRNPVPPPLAWRPQSSGKVEKANDILKKYLCKLTQETHLSWPLVLPIALLRIRNTHSSLRIRNIKDLGYSPYEMFYGCPFLINDFLLDRETVAQEQDITALAKFQQFSETRPRDPQVPPLMPRDLMLIRTLPTLSTTLGPQWQGPYPIILSIPMAVKVSCFKSCIHLSQVKPWMPSQEENETMPSPPDEQKSYSCEPLGSLKLLFKINPGGTTDTR